MRTKRVRKYRNRYRKTIVGFHLLMIWSSVLLLGTQFNSYTNASFNDIEQVHGSLQVDWEDLESPVDDEWGKSSIVAESAGGSCETGIYAIFRNKGESVNHELSTYEVYWSMSGNPKSGDLLATGEYPIPNKGETVEITYMPEKSGVYKIIAYQEAGHPGNNDGGPWSDSITVDCGTQQGTGSGLEKEDEKDTVAEEPSEEDTKQSVENNSNDEVENQDEESINQEEQSENDQTEPRDSGENATAPKNDNADSVTDLVESTNSEEASEGTNNTNGVVKNENQDEGNQ